MGLSSRQFVESDDLVIVFSISNWTSKGPRSQFIPSLFSILRSTGWEPKIIVYAFRHPGLMDQLRVT